MNNIHLGKKKIQVDHNNTEQLLT